MPRRVLAPLIVAFVLALGCFLTSTWYTETVSGHVSDAATGIATTAIPSIVELTTTRQELRRLDLAAERFEETRGAAERAAVAAARDRVDAAFERYLALPSGAPGDRGLSAMHHALAQVDRALGDLLGGTATGTSAEVTRAVDDASDAIRQAIVRNADRAGALAATIEAERRHALAVAWALDLASALLTAAAAFVALRGLVLHQRVVEANRRLLEQRADELEQFAARVAHDIVSPLTVTRLAIESTLPELDDRAHRKLERAERGLGRVVTVVDGLLQFARAGARPEPGARTDVGQVARAVVDELEPRARAHEVALSFTGAAGCAVAAHEGVIASVVENLTGNAITHAGDRAHVDVRVRGGDDVVRVEVEDDGPGVPPELRATIWDPHVRGRDRHAPGLGLGLATVRRIVQAHGGQVGVESRPGAGSLFWCELPRAPRPAAGAP